MKNNTLFSKSLIAAACALFSSAFVACDNIDEDDRYREVEAVAAERAVLIEDYTGQNCVNCPDAHEVIEALEEQYGEDVIAVSIHAGDGFVINRDMTRFASGFIGLGTPEGAHYYSLNELKSNPIGIINGRGGAQDYKSWAGVVRNELERPTELAIDLSATLNPDSNEIDIDVQLLPHGDLNGQLYVWILESDIVARQKTSTGMIKDYVHNNVFRAAVNDVDGESVSLESGVHFNADYSIAVRDNEEEKWVPENMSVIAFLKTANGVENVAKAKVQVD
ncbi:MAG: Omp28 family outer membrane lipoprotein [Muribaculaceae bacterium]|nr:Omp28 family outer membrane lipoprotein [Muribaculaceae bacterium]